MPKFSFLTPTRNRPELVRRLFQSIVDTTSCIDDIEVVLCVDDDDIESQKISDNRIDVKKIVLPRGATMGELNRACFNASSGRYVMGMNDDIILRTKNWDKVVSGVLSAFNDDIALIHINDLLFKEKLCCFPMVSRRACEAIGFCPPEYKRYRIDDHIYDIYNMLAYLGHKRIIYLPDVIFEHDNFAHQHDGTGPTFVSEDNRVYSPNKEIIEWDAKIFDNKLEERKQSAIKLAGLIDASINSARQVGYKGILSRIRDASYRRSDFVTVRKTELEKYEPEKRPSVTVAVVSADIRREHPRKCLSLLKKHTRDFDLVILDNNNGKDFNHPREMNKVLQMVKTDFLVLMDDDVYVEEGWLDALLKSMDEKTGVVSPLHKDRHGKLSYAGAYMTGDGLGTHDHLFDRPEKPVETQIACSAVLLIDMMKCGHILFNTDYKKYFLDLDYSLQVWEAGYKVVCTPYTTATHLGGATMPWSSEQSRALVQRDAGIFTEIWVNTGRLKGIENGIWMDYPAVKRIVDMPVSIRRFFEGADELEIDQFISGADGLYGDIKLTKLFYADMIGRLQEYSSKCNSMGDYTRARHCEKLLDRLTGTSNAYRALDSFAKVFLARLLAFVRSNAIAYRLARFTAKVLKAGLDRYLRLPLKIRNRTDGLVFRLYRIYTKVS